MYEMACLVYEMPSGSRKMKVMPPPLCLCKKIINFVS